MLTRELDQVAAILTGARWWTLDELVRELAARYDRFVVATSVSARIREVDGVEKRRRGGKGNLWEYRVKAEPPPGTLF